MLRVMLYAWAPTVMIVMFKCCCIFLIHFCVRLFCFVGSVSLSSVYIDSYAAFQAAA